MENGNYQCSDKAEEIQTIKWTQSGKIKEIIRTSSSTKPNLEFFTEVSGQVVVNGISDLKIRIPFAPSNGTVAYYEADVHFASDYFPFGMVMPGRSFSSPEYRFGFNGMEKDGEEWTESEQIFDRSQRQDVSYPSVIEEDGKLFLICAVGVGQQDRHSPICSPLVIV